ncbi:hypothetical protein ES703_80767 [subsurface metagenome]
MPLNNPSAGTLVTTGSYTGDASASKAIPHGMPRVPKMVTIWRAEAGDHSGLMFFIHKDRARIHDAEDGSDTSLAVTAMNTTNFYVGNASEYNHSANYNLMPYKWVAIG